MSSRKLEFDIKKLSTDNLPIALKTKIWARIITNLELININDISLKIKINDYTRCDVCHTHQRDLANQIRLGYITKCCHMVCTTCMIQAINDVTEGSFDDSFKLCLCPKCHTGDIPEDEILNIVPYTTIVTQNKEKVKSVDKFNCVQCLLEKPCIWLKCKHTYCYDCLLMLIDKSMTENKFVECGICSNVEQPRDIPGKKEGLGMDLVYTLCNKKNVNKMFEIAYQKYKSQEVDLIGKGGYIDTLVTCSNCKNVYSFPTHKDAISKECPHCYFYDHKNQMRYWNCMLCCEQAHEGKSCKEAAAMNPELQKILKNNPDIRICPYCFEPTSRISGCNMMACKSKKCAPLDNTFCYICQQKIEPKHDYKHFLAYGHSSQWCKNRQKTD